MTGQHIEFRQPEQKAPYDLGTDDVELAVWGMQMVLSPPMVLDSVASAVDHSLPRGTTSPLRGYGFEYDTTVNEEDLVDTVHIRHVRLTDRPSGEHDEVVGHLREIAPVLAQALGASSVTYAWE